jgi:hypothetical protein
MPMPPLPSIVSGMLPAPAPDTSQIVSPQWAKYLGGSMIEVPNLWRGVCWDFFTWLATNNGAQRQLDKRLGLSSTLYNVFDDWGRANPGLIYSSG